MPADHAHAPPPPAPPLVEPAREPRLIGIEHTLAHLARWLPPAPARLIELGAGDGLLAAALIARGYEVLAVDTNPEMIAAARARGVPAVCADAVTFTSAQPCDAVLFAHALHHMGPLDVALAHAEALLVPGGLLLLEEFAWETLDRDAARWIHEMFAVLEAAGLIPEPWVAGLDVEQFRCRWHREYGDEHALHTGATLLAAVRERFELLEAAPATYLYRYLCRRLEKTEVGARVARAAFVAEDGRVREGHLRSIGWRLTARRRPSGV